MSACQVLLIHSSGVSPVAVQKLLEEHDFLIHLTRSWEEAERTCTLIPVEQLKFVFVDIALCTTSQWEQFVKRMQAAASGTVFIHFHSRFPHSLVPLLDRNGRTSVEGESTETQAPTIVGEGTKFREVLA